MDIIHQITKRKSSLKSLMTSVCKTKLIARLVLQQKGKNLLANISTSRASLLQGQYLIKEN